MDFRICRDGIERDGIERDPYLKLLLSPPHMLFALQSQPHLGTLLPLRRVWCLLVLSKNVGTYEPSFGSLCTVTFLAKRKRVPENTIPTAGTEACPDGTGAGGAYEEGQAATSGVYNCKEPLGL